MTKHYRAPLLIWTLVFSLGLASVPAAFAQDKMGKDTMSKDTMSKDAMKKDDARSKDGIEKGCNVQRRYEEERRDVQGSHEAVTASGSQVAAARTVGRVDE